MMDLDKIERDLMRDVSGVTGIPAGAYNFRVNGKSIGRNSSSNIDISPKTDKSGIDIHVQSGTKGEIAHIPVIISASGLKEAVYNDFYIGDNCEVTIIAGCGIYNCGVNDSVHDGIHTFYIGKNSTVYYIEKHCGIGPGAGKILNPTTKLFLGNNSRAELLMEQIKGVDSSNRITEAELDQNAQIVVKEKLFTHGKQHANSAIKVTLLGKNSTADIVSRAVAQDISVQNFSSHIIGTTKCRGHSECDAIIMDQAKVNAEPALEAQNVDAELIHEAAIGKIANEQLLKLMTLGLTRRQAESQIINGFLK
ncbi:SufD family Fe-S cluster assembly protein [Candidatus Saccharibacteria bacterium]|nr:SufD family Fe-S cluster assembly protein [Candidatus Saccharibacteria bacterium]